METKGSDAAGKETEEKMDTESAVAAENNGKAKKRKRTDSASSDSSSSSSDSNPDEKPVPEAEPTKEETNGDGEMEKDGEKPKADDGDEEEDNKSSLDENAVEGDEEKRTKGDEDDDDAAAEEGEEKEVVVEDKKEEDAAESAEVVDLVKEKPEPGSTTRALHKTSSIFLRNLAPTITKAEVEAVCRRYDGYLRVAIADPLVERRWFRRGWVSFMRDVNIKEICWNLNNIRVSGLRWRDQLRFDR